VGCHREDIDQSGELMIELTLTPLLDGVTAFDGLVPLQNNDDALEDWQAMALVAGLCFPVGLAVIKMGFDRYHSSRIVANTGTERIRSMAVGRTELKGTARQYDRTYAQPFEDGECLLAEYSVQELVTKEDGDEKKQVWETVTSGTLGDRIVLEDETGAVVVKQPSMTYSRELETRKKQGILANIFEGTFVGDWFGLGPNESTVAFLEERNISLRTNRRRLYEQKVVPSGTELYVLGQATERDDDAEDDAIVERLAGSYDRFLDALVIEGDDGSGEYIVTDKNEGGISRHHLLRALLAIVGGVGFVVLGAVFLGLSLQEYGLI